jgi:hypothetical protein
MNQLRECPPVNELTGWQRTLLWLTCCVVSGFAVAWLFDRDVQRPCTEAQPAALSVGEPLIVSQRLPAPPSGADVPAVMPLAVDLPIVEGESAGLPKPTPMSRERHGTDRGA